MPTTAEVIRERLRAAFPDAEVEVRDTTGGGDHFAATVVTSAFQDRGLVDRHRMVYDSLGDAMRTDIHALALHTLTPAERSQKP